jgi:branched-chain amino acid transport system substrate-binding protein
MRENNNNTMILGGNVLVNTRIEQINTKITKEKFVVTSFWHPLASDNSQFAQNAQQLWGESINGRTALTYDATLALIKAIEPQNNPTRKGTLAELKTPGFSFIGATGEGKFNTPINGDRLNFKPTLLHLVPCQNGDRFYNFVPIQYTDAQTAGLSCQ